MKLRTLLFSSALLFAALPPFLCGQEVTVEKEAAQNRPVEKDSAGKEKVPEPSRTGEVAPADKAAGEDLSAGKNAGTSKRLKMADALQQQGDEEGALQILEDISKDRPDDADLHQRIAEIHLRAQRFAEAVPHLRRILEIRGGSEAEYGMLIRGLSTAGLAEESLQLLEDAAERFPNSPEIPFLGTFAYAAAEQWPEAIAQFKKVIAVTPEKERELVLDDRFHFRFAVAQERAGNLPESVDLLRKALTQIEKKAPAEEDPGFHATVLNYLAYLWIERSENLDEAGRLALEAAELDPESGAIADTVGWWYFQKGDYPRALANLKKAERLIEDPDPVIFDHLGQTLLKLNEKAFAAEYFRLALEMDPGITGLKERLAEAER